MYYYVCIMYVDNDNTGCLNNIFLTLTFTGSWDILQAINFCLPFYCEKYPCLPEENVIELDVTIVRSVLACPLHEVGELLLRPDVHDDELGAS